MAGRFVVTMIGFAVTLWSTVVFPQARRQVPVPKTIIIDLLRDTAFTKWIVVPMSPAHIAANLVAEPLDLNGDGAPELEVRGINAICQVNNCVAWIYRRSKAGYERVLTAGSVDDIEPQSTISNGYRVSSPLTTNRRGLPPSRCTSSMEDGISGRAASPARIVIWTPTIVRMTSGIRGSGRWHVHCRPPSLIAFERQCA